jgi:ribonucleotide reductase beta subunit family protein with ferritin-like domain
MYLFRAILDFFKDRIYRNLSISTLLVLVNGTIVYHFVEGWRWLDSLYFSVITLTTVGYGDLSPQTDFGKIFTIIYILTGIGIIFGFINTFYLQRSKRMMNLRDKIKHK